MPFKTILTDFVDLVFPNICESCTNSLSKSERLICTECRLAFPKTNFHQIKANPFYQKFQGQVPIDHAFSYLYYQKTGRVQKLLQALKYNNKPEIGLLLGRWYASFLLEDNSFVPNWDVIIPIPLHPKKLKKRGYNQSEKFGQGLSEVLNIPLNTDSLIRTKFTDTQTKKSKEERWKNVNKIFEVKNQQLKNKRILLVDDVVTTGATMEAAIQALLTQEVQGISITTIAYAMA